MNRYLVATLVALLSTATFATPTDCQISRLSADPDSDEILSRALMSLPRAELEHLCAVLDKANAGVSLNTGGMTPGGMLTAAVAFTNIYDRDSGMAVAVEPAPGTHAMTATDEAAKREALYKAAVKSVEVLRTKLPAVLPVFQQARATVRMGNK